MHKKTEASISGVNLHLSENVAKTLECNFMTGNLKWTEKNGSREKKIDEFRLMANPIPLLDQKITRLN